MMSALDFKEKQIIFVNGREKEKFSFKNDNLIIKDENDNTIHQSSCHQLFALYIIGHFTITLPLIERAKKFGFSLVLMTYSFRLIEVMHCGLQGNYLLHKKQYQKEDIEIGKMIIKNKINNQIQELVHKRDKSLQKSINDMKYLVSLMNEERDFYSIMSIEGQAAKKYFKGLFKENNWKGRKPRTKIDPFNSVLDIGYTLLFQYIESLVALYDFDAYIGVFHKQFYKRKSLICDLVEPFRVIIDHETLKSFNLGKFKFSDFIYSNGQYFLNIKYSANYANTFLQAINKNKLDMFYFIQSYYRWYMKEHDYEKFPTYNWRESC